MHVIVVTFFFWYVFNSICENAKLVELVGLLTTQLYNQLFVGNRNGDVAWGETEFDKCYMFEESKYCGYWLLILGPKVHLNKCKMI